MNLSDTYEYAPVIIPTLCRFDHFKRCVDSLSKCVGADKTDLIIGLDYPLKESHKKGNQLIREYLKNEISGFNKIEVIERKYNFGAKGNIDDLFEYVRSKYETYIFTEDDNEFSPNFLLYINEGLAKYKTDDRVYSISGYCYPVDTSACDTNVFPVSTYSAFGCGRWSNKHPVFDNRYLRDILYSPIKLFKIYKERPISLLNFANMILKKEIYGDVCFGIYLILNNKYSIYPQISKVRNHGYDGSGEHCGTTNAELYKKQLLDKNVSFEYDDVSLDIGMPDAIKKYLNISNKAKVLAWIKIFCAQLYYFFA